MSSKLILKSSDGKVFEVKEAAALLFSSSPLRSMSNKLILKSSDGKVFEVKEAAALLSQTLIRHMVEDRCREKEIPIPDVTGDILSKVVEYCEKHTELPAASEEYKRWDADFILVDQSTLLALIHAASYLDIKSLLDLTCRTVQDMLLGKTEEEFHEFFNIKF